MEGLNGIRDTGTVVLGQHARLLDWDASILDEEGIALVVAGHSCSQHEFHDLQQGHEISYRCGLHLSFRRVRLQHHPHRAK